MRKVLLAKDPLSWSSRKGASSVYFSVDEFRDATYGASSVLVFVVVEFM